MSPAPTYIEEGGTLCKVVYADMAVIGYAPTSGSTWYYKYVIAENKLYTWHEVGEDDTMVWYEVITNGVFNLKYGASIKALYGE